MNRVLFEAEECATEGRLTLSDRRFEHLTQVLKTPLGAQVRVGMINGPVGFGEVVALSAESLTLQLELKESPPPAHPAILVLALPRPKMLRRILRSCAEFGVRQIYLIHSYRVEKSFWHSPLLQPENIRAALLAGLERSGGTELPSWQLHHRFKPFIEDCLPSLAADRTVAMAHPQGGLHLLDLPAADPVILIGPEGGFIPYETDLAQRHGAQLVSLGARVLSVDTAVPAALAMSSSKPPA